MHNFPMINISGQWTLPFWPIDPACLHEQWTREAWRKKKKTMDIKINDSDFIYIIQCLRWYHITCTHRWNFLITVNICCRRRRKMKHKQLQTNVKDHVSSFEIKIEKRKRGFWWSCRLWGFPPPSCGRGAAQVSAASTRATAVSRLGASLQYLIQI